MVAARAADWYPGYGAAASPPSPEAYLPSPELLARCGAIKTVRQFGGGDFVSLQAAVNSLGNSISTNTCVVVIDSNTYNEAVTVQNIATNGYRLHLMKDPALSVSPTLNPWASAAAGFLVLNDSVTISGINIVPSAALDNGVYASSSSVAVSSVTVYGGANLSAAGIVVSSGGLVEFSTVTAQDARGIVVGGELSRVSYSYASVNSGSKWALYLPGASSNTVESSYFHNAGGTGGFFAPGSTFNRVTASTMTSYGSTHRGLVLDNSSSNTISGSYIADPNCVGLYIGGGYGNKIEQSTVSSNASSYPAFYIGSPATRADGVRVTNGGGIGLIFENDGGSVFSNGRVTVNSSSLYAVRFNNTSTNTVIGSYIMNGSGDGVRFESGAMFNVLAQSTVTAANPTRFGVSINGASTTTVRDSYVQGPFGVNAQNSNIVMLRGNTVVATESGGAGLSLQNTSGVLSATSTYSGGPQGRGVYVGAGNSGKIELASNTITTAGTGLQLASPGGANLQISSISFRSLAAGATAVLLEAAGTFNFELHKPGFYSANIAVNIAAEGVAGGLVNVREPAGTRASVALANDPMGVVQWPWPAAQSVAGVNGNSVTVSFIGNGAQGYEVLASTSFPGSAPPWTSTATAQELSQLTLAGLAYNTTYYVAAGALWDQTTYYYSSKLEPVTQIEDPATVVVDEVGVTTITASAYAPGAAFTNLQLGQSGVAVSTDGAYDVWGSSGNYWTGKAAMATPRSALAAAVIGGKLYALGGNGGASLTANEEYDPAANSWVTKMAMPTAREYLAVAALGGKLYAVGGYNGSSRNTNEEYDPAANSWTTKATMPTARHSLAAAVVGGKLYAVGGINGASLDTNEEYDPSTDAWATKMTMPSPRSYLGAAAIGGKIYAVGGNNGPDLNANAEYDPALNSWVTKATMPTARSGLAVAAVGGKMYAVGGFNGAAADANETYDPSTDSWSTKSAMPAARSYLAAAALGGKVYAIGGSLNTNEAYVPGVARVFTGLRPNTQYTFHAKARNQQGLVGAASLSDVSTRTLAAVGLPPGGQPFGGLSAAGVTVSWSSGSPSVGYNGPGASYKVQASTSADFSGAPLSSTTFNLSWAAGLAANTTYFFRIKAYNSGGYTDDLWTPLGSTATLIEQPTSVYIDEVTTTSILASAYAPSPAFTGLDRGLSAVAVSSGAYDLWNSSGGYWAARAPLSSSRYMIAGAAYNGRIHALGGDSGPILNNNDQYDPASDAWTPKTSMLTARFGLAAAVVGGRLYALGGNTGLSTNKNEEYDPAADGWITKAALPSPRHGLAAATLGGRLYAVGGYNGGVLSLNEEYDPAANAWATRAAMPTPRYLLAAGVVDGKLYAVGGADGLALDHNEQYDPAANAWATKAAMPTSRQHLAAGTIGGKLYALGGSDGPALNVNEEYDPVANAWVTRAHMSAARQGLAAVVLGGRLYALGGLDGVHLSVNESYVPGTARKFGGLKPNTLYTFKARARSQNGSVTGDSALVSTYTLAAVGLPANGKPFGAVYASSAAVNWSSGSAAGFNDPGASFLVVASTSQDFLGTNVSSDTYNVDGATLPLAANTTYYFRVRAYNSGRMTDYSWLVLGSTVTNVNPPAYLPAVSFASTTLTVQWGANGNGPNTWYTVQAATSTDYTTVAGSSVTLGTTAVLANLLPNTSYYTRVRAVNQAGSPTNWVDLDWLDTAIEPAEGVYIDEVAVATITASAWARGAAFSNLHAGVSAVAVSSGTFDVWGSSGGYWDTRAALPTPRYYLAAASLGGKVYALGGYNGVYYDQNEEYDPAAGAWTTRAPLPAARGKFGAAALGGKIYAVGGSNSGGFVLPTDVYDPAANAWVSKAGLPQPRLELSVAAAGGRIYALGGFNSGYKNSNYAYDAAADTWTAKAPLPSARSNAAAAAAFGKIYLLGGNTGAASNVNYEYNPAADSWATRAALTASVYYHAAAAVGGKVYVIGGYNGASTGDASAYDPMTDSWTSKPAMSAAREALAAAAAGGNIYAFGGSNGGARMENEAYHAGVSRRFTGLRPNTLYGFKAKARNRSGDATAETGVISTYTLAYVGLPKNGSPFTGVLGDQVSVAWSSGTDAAGYNGPGASFLLNASTAADFSGAVASSLTFNGAGALLGGLAANSTYYFRVQAYNAGGMTDHGWLALGSTVTRIETPTSVYIDEVGTTTIAASAYAPGAAFTGLGRPGSAVAVTTSAAFDVWNSSGDYWTGRADLPTARSAHAAAVLGGRIYSIGGNGAPATANYEYDPAANSWGTRAPLPTGRFYLAAGAVGGKLYAVGGSGGEALNEAYDPAANSWSTKAPLPTSRMELAVAVIGDKLYALGGNQGGSILKTVEMYDPAADAWTTRAQMQGGRAIFAAGAIGGKLYVAGGLVGAGSYTAAAEEYDPAGDAWSPKAAMPAAVSGLAGGVLGGKLYVAGGYDGSHYASFLQYDPAADTWTARAPMQFARAELAVCAAGGALYAFGGSNGSAVNYNERYAAGAARAITGLKPNTQYTFKAKARGQDGTLTAESAEVSTYTLAAVALLPDGHTFDNVYISSVIVAWASGTAAGGYNGPDAFYELQGSTAPDFTGALALNSGWNPVHMNGLAANTTYFFRIKAWNAGGYTDGRWLSLGSTVTHVETPESVYFEGVSASTIVVSAYAPGAAFSGLERGLSGVNIALDGAYGVWGSSGNYWVPRAPMLSPRYMLAAAAGGGKIYTIGGTTDGGTGLALVTEYDVALNAWTAKASLGTPRAGAGAAYLDGKVYAVGGIDSGSYKAETEVYDPAANAWTTKAPMAVGRFSLAVAALNGKIYAAGGSNAGGGVLLNQAYDPAADSWTTMAAMPGDLYDGASAAADGKLYLMGGNGSAVKNLSYDPAADSWATGTPPPAPRIYLAAAAVGGKIYTFGGNPASAATEMYDPALDLWATRAPMPAARDSMSAVAAGGRIFVISGSGAAQSVVEEYRPGVSSVFSGLAPNTLHSFKARARGQDGHVTGESAQLSTWTLAAAPADFTPAFSGVSTGALRVQWAANGNPAYTTYYAQLSALQDFSAVAASSLTMNSFMVFENLGSNTSYYARVAALNNANVRSDWLAAGSTVTLVNAPLAQPALAVATWTITAAWGANGNPGDTWYNAEAASDPGFTGIVASSRTTNVSAVLAGLPIPNVYYFLRVNAVNRAGSPTGWVGLASTATAIEQPVSVYFDEVDSMTVTASAYAPLDAFTGLSGGQSGVNLTTGTLYGGWNQAVSAWGAKAAIAPARSMLAGAALGGKLYSFGGYNGTVQNLTHEYDPVTDLWTTRQTMPTARYGLAAAAAGGKIFVMGGTAGVGNLDVNEAFDPEADAWTTMTPSKNAHFKSGAAAIGGKIYLCGLTAEVYDAELDAWADIAPLLAPRDGLAVAALNGKVYAIGGGAGVKDVEEYDPALNLWTSRAGMTTARYGLGAAVIGGKIHAVAGYDGASYLNNNEVYDPAVDAWTAQAALAGIRSDFVLAALRGRLYAFGGYDGSYLSSMRDYYPGVSRVFGGLTPNTQYAFKAKARNAERVETVETVQFSTWTLAVPPAAKPHDGVFVSSAALAWGEGDNPPGTTLYRAQVSTSPQFSPVAASSETYNGGAVVEGLLANTTYYARVAAVNGAGVPTAYVPLDPAVTRVETPAAIHFDEVSTGAVTASVYAPSPAFTGLDRGLSGVNITTEAAFGVWGSTGDHWTGKADMFTARGQFGAAAAGGRVYAIGGFNGANTGANEAYDPAAGAWQTRQDLPTLRNSAAVAALGGKIYVVGGYYSAAYMATNEEYDPVADTWLTRAAMPTGREAPGAAAAGGLLYVVGGAGGPQKTEVYDPAANAWTTRADLNSSRNNLALVESGGRLYALGGSMAEAANAEYDPGADAWTTKAALPTPRSYPAAAALGGKIYVLGGGSGPSDLAVNEEYDPAADAWVTRAALPAPRQMAAAAALGGRIYLFGGYYNSSAVKTSFVYDPGTARVFSGLAPNTQYFFKAKLRGQAGGETPEVAGSTWTLAAKPAGAGFSSASPYALWLAWDGGANPAGTGYSAELSTSPDYAGVLLSSRTVNAFAVISGLASNATYYGRVAAVNGAGVFSDYKILDATATRMETPVSIYVDEVGSAAVTASAYAASPAFSGLERGLSGVNIALDGAYGVWGSSGNYWAVKAPLAVNAGEAAAAVVGARLYVVGGWVGGAPFDHNSEYDPAADAWVTKAPMPTARHSLAAAALGGRLYALGGRTGVTSLAVNEEYDPAANSWETKASLPTARYDLAAAAAGGKIYALCGRDGGASNANEAYDPARDSWSAETPPLTPRYGLSAAVIDGKIHLAGGYDGNYTARHETYDPATDSWEVRADLPTARYQHAAAAVGGKMYVFGGTESGGRLAVNEVYDPAANAWAAAAPLPAGRTSMAAAALAGRIYAVGGHDGAYTSQSTEYVPGVSMRFGGLLPNKAYSIKAKARNLQGIETGESVEVSTYTLAVVREPADGVVFTGVFPSSVTVAYSSGSAAGGFNGPGASYLVEASTAADFTGALYAGAMLSPDDLFREVTDLPSNTTFHFRVRAYNAGGMTDHSWLTLGSTVTQAIVPNAAAAPFSSVGHEALTVHWGANNNADGTAYSLQFSTNAGFTPPVFGAYPTLVTTHSVTALLSNTTYYARVAAVSYSGVQTAYYVIGATVTALPAPSGVYFDEVGSATIVASAYAAAFTGLERGVSGVNLTTGAPGAYGEWTAGGNAWTSRAALPVAYYRAAAAALGGKLYLFGGDNDGLPFDYALEYDPAVGTWASKSVMPSRRYAPAAAALGGKLFVVGGNDGGMGTAVEEYDPAADAWTSRPAMSEGRVAPAAAAIDGKLYVAGGFGAGYLNSVELYDPAAGAWTTGLTGMLTGRMAPAYGVIGGKLYLAGGFNGATMLYTAEEYDPVTDTWTMKADMPYGGRAFAAGAVAGGKLYVVGGQDNGSGWVARNEVYDPASDTWAWAEPMGAARRYAAGAAVGGRVFVAGGLNNGGHAADFEEYFPGVTKVFNGLKPDTAYTFYAKARNQAGLETAEASPVSTRTLAAVSAPQQGPLFDEVWAASVTVHWSSGTAAAGFNAAGARYQAGISASPDFVGGDMVETPSLSNSFDGLAANTTYFFRARARNSGGVLDYQWQVLGATPTLAAQPAGLSVFAVFPTSASVSWNALPFGQSEGFRVEASTAADFSGVVRSSASAVYSAAALTVENLLANATYYLRVGSLNRNGAAHYALAGGTLTPKENIPPTYVNLESYDYTWFSASSRSYNVEFHDAGGSALRDVQVRAATAPAQAGLVTLDWTDVLSGLGVDDYVTGWSIPGPAWDLLQDGTNYITIRVYDGSGNSDTAVDAFVVFKDTTPPAVSESYDDAVWRSTYGFNAVVSVADPHSGIDRLQYAVYSSSDGGGAQVTPWTDIAPGSGVKAMSLGVTIDEGRWDLLANGTNYFALRAWDYSLPVNTGTVNDVFYVLKDTAAPAAASPSAAPSQNALRVFFPAPAEWPSGLAEYALQYSTYAVALSTEPVFHSTHVYVSTSGVVSGEPQELLVGGLDPNTTQYLALWSRDVAGNWSAPAAAAAATLAEQAPFRAQSVQVTSAAIGWTPVFSAGYRLEASSSPVFAAVIFSSATGLMSVDSLTVTGLTPNLNYSFRWASLNWAGLKNYGPVYNWTTYAAVPASATVYAAVSSNAVSVEWLANGNSEYTEYVLAVSSDDFVTLLSSAAVAPAGAGPFISTFTSLQPNTTYWFRAQAHGANGVYTAWLPLGSTVTLPVPPIITGYTLWRSSVSVTWDSNGNGAGTQYQADLSTASDFSVSEISAATGGLSLDLPVLTPNTTYYLRLRSASSASGQLSAYAGAAGVSRAEDAAAVNLYTLGPNAAGLYWGTGNNPGGQGASDWSGAGSLYGARYGHSIALAGDVLLASGGSDGAGYRSDVWAAPLPVTGQLGAWHRVRSLPGARYGHASVALNGRLYVLGGYDGSAPRAEVWSAPVSSTGALGEWVSENPLPVAVYAHALAVVSDRLYVLGGYNGGARSEIYSSPVGAEGRLGAWLPAGSLPDGRYALGAGVAISSGPARLCVAGGNDGVTARAEVWTAALNGDGTVSGWTAGPALPGARFGHGTAFLAGGIFVAGGNNGSSAKDTVYRAAVGYGGVLGQWETQPPLQAASQSFAFGERSGLLLAFGGYDGASPSGQVYKAQVRGTEYSVDVAGASFSSTPWLAAGYLQLGGLAPDASYTFRVKARNYAGVETPYGAPATTTTYAAQPSTAAFGSVFISSAQVNWSAADNPAWTLYDAQLSSDAAHTLLAASFTVAAAGHLFAGLDADHLYYARVRAVNAAGTPTSWTELGQFMTRSDPALDFSSPTMTGAPAAAWRNAPGALYDIDFADAGGAYLDRFEVAAATYAAAAPLSWAAVSTGINSHVYAADWELPAGMFELLAPGTNYLSVRAFDGNGNSTTAADAFLILKDTVAPSITGNQAGESFWRMDDGGAIYDVDFADALSGLAAIEYSASPNQGSGDAAGYPWTPVAALSTGPAVYAGAWAVDFAGLPNDATSYISVRARDLAGNTQAVAGIDAFKILKYVAGPETWLTLPASAYRSALAVVTGTASDARSHPLAAVEVSVLETATGKYWDGGDFLASSPKWAVATGTASWSYVPGVAWLDGSSYEIVARSSDTAGNYSLVYATRVFTFDSQAPVITAGTPADGAVVNSAASIGGTTFDLSGVSALALKLQRSADGLWWDFAAGTWTVSGSSAAVAAAANWSYAPGELLKASLENGASYYYTLYAADNSVPAKASAFGTYGATFGFVDDTAPSAIADFRASTGNAPGNVSLLWTQPGDDGASGMILYGQYRVEYATYAAHAFSTAAAQAYGDFTAVSAGSARNRELSGLVPGETYYLRAWTRDDAGNWSALSNGATAQASPFPDRIGGHVTTVSSAGVTGVLMEAYDAAGVLRASAYTVNDGSGSYALTGLPAGSYRVQATWEADDIISSVGADGLVLGRSDADFTLSVSYQLASIGGELAGYRLSALGRRALSAGAPAKVELYQRGRLIASAPVDPAGKFLIGNLLPGKYVLRVPRNEGGYKELSVRVKAGEALNISPLGELLKTARVYAYPNPARRTATFHLESEQSPVTKSVTVFDVTGRVVKEFKDGDFTSPAANVYEARWDIPSKVASGVYIYAVRVKFEATGEYKKAVKKFAIVK